MPHTDPSILDKIWSTESRTTLSFEFFPPKDEAGIETTKEVIREISTATLPDFVTVTFGAGGTARGLSRRLVQFCTNELKLPTIAHITSRDLTVAEINQILDEYREAGAFGILALRGDPPKGSTVFIPHPGGFQTSCDLVKHTADRREFMVAVAGYPEKHRDASSMAADIDYLKRKIDSGATAVVTQLFFDNSHFYRYCEDLERAGVTVPVLAGIMPVANLSQVTRFIELCGATLPAAYLKRLEAAGDDTDEVIKIGTEHAIHQCQNLLENKIRGLHLYTLNRPKQIKEIVRSINR